VQVDVAKGRAWGDCGRFEFGARIEKMLNFVCEGKGSKDRVKQ
jgi:hypothetical protein